jgi:hypothetical protein
MTTNIATETANKSYKYNDSFFGKKLSDIVNSVHKHYSEKMKWTYKPLFPGTFGYDNLAISIAYTLSSIKNKKYEINELATLVHEGWIINYLYWRNNKPYLTNEIYKKPYNPLGDERRDKCASLSFDQLDKEEQDKDIIIAEYLIKIIQ